MEEVGDPGTGRVTAPRTPLRARLRSPSLREMSSCVTLPGPQPQAQRRACLVFHDVKTPPALPVR